MEALVWSKNQALLNSELLALKPIVVFVLIRGRNAWHSTWVQKYQGPGAVYATRVAAKDAAERQRVQGSTFYIRAVPALLLESEAGSVVQVEFHSDKTFGKLSVSDVIPRLAYGATMSEALLVLGRNGGFWRSPLPSKHSFIQARHVLFADLEPLKARMELAMLRSSSRGPRYFLDWQESPGAYDTSVVRRICREYAKLNADSTEERASRLEIWRARRKRADLALADLAAAVDHLKRQIQSRDE